MGSKAKRILGLLAAVALCAACPAMTPTGGPSNPAGFGASEKSGSENPGSGDASTGGSSDATNTSAEAGATPPSSAPPSNAGTGDSVYVVARGGTFPPKGDGEAVGSDQQKEATDWRLRIGVNAWWELSRTTPDTYPLFQNTTTDFKMKLEFFSREAGYWIPAGPVPKVPVVRMVYQPKGQPPSSAQSFDAPVVWALPEGDNVDFLNLTLGEGTLTFTVEYDGVTHPLGILQTYYSNIDTSVTSAPALFQSK